jgi:four helix bundle protein
MARIIESFRELDVYQKAYKLSISIHRATKAFPKEELFALTGQMRRASKGIRANLAEGFMKQQFSKPEFKRFLTIAMGSATEMQVWLDFSADLGYLTAQDATDLRNEYNQLGKMLQRFYQTI